MTMISPEIQQALEAAHGGPIKVVDPTTQRVYVVVPAEAFEKLRAMVDDWDPRSMYPTMAEVMQDDWKDMESYDE
jgi:hypothetical protein